MDNKPKASVVNGVTAIDSLKTMLEVNSDLYNSCISLPNFAFHFGQLCNKAIHYDFIVENLLPDYAPKDKPTL